MNTKSPPAELRDQRKSVRDRKGTQYELTEKIGQGGQGVVWRIRGGTLAAKLLRNASKNDREVLTQRLAFVRRLDLKGLAIARPLETLDPPHCGYVMQFLRDMVPVSRLFDPGKGKVMAPEWYHQTGGLKRRLRLMAKVARLLGRLHAKGLIYGDLSAENVFISENPAHDEVWMIDADNLEYQSQPSGSERCTYTPGFGAPELVSGRGCSSSLSDNYAFAVLCFKVLSLVHPFLGDYVNEGEPELEEAAFAGEIPWIEDPDDATNRTGHGVPREWVLSNRLRALFEKAFGVGRQDRLKRPSAEAWADVLETAAHMTLECPKCSASYYFNQPQCPYCQHKPPAFCQFYSFLWDPKTQEPFLAPNKKPKPLGQAVISENDKYEITHAIGFGSEAENRDDVICTLLAVGNRLELLHPNGLPEPVRLLQGGKSILAHGKQTGVTLGGRGGSFEMHFGPKDQAHRYLLFEVKGTRS